MSFLNFACRIRIGSVYGSSPGSLATSVLKLEGLYFLKPRANATPYLGGGFSYGITDVDATFDNGGFQGNWNGSGLQGELTVGYEWLRASRLRAFVQADTTLPFYNVMSQTYSYSQLRPTITTASRYAPSIVVSLGLGF